jgi:hypothetical protein
MFQMTAFSFEIMKLFFDTETTGLANFQQEANHPSQPRLVQLAAILTDEACEEISTGHYTTPCLHSGNEFHGVPSTIFLKESFVKSNPKFSQF